ncbi:MAG: hypothetical protein KBG28_09720 [Kofleriaceae bacterium]|jgi:hypothetical protein|nr:hypothetical protein [Kofleriaceae bacterium]MBP9204230.1 hypothetical protein [Kofleriaceae bacterium]
MITAASPGHEAAAGSDVGGEGGRGGGEGGAGDGEGGSIGAATMQADGTLILQLRAEAEDGTIGDALLTYRPDHPRYAAVLAHLGPLRPGATCMVKPWPRG